MRKLGFTLAEVLITLVIIGVIAAMTVPTLMNNTNAQEFRSALKKAISSLNQAIEREYAVNSLNVGDYDDASGLATNLFGRNLQVIEDSYTIPDGSEFPAGDASFVTADGMAFSIQDFNKDNCDFENETPCGVINIDVNGSKGPNKITTSAKAPKDIYKVNLFNQRAVAGDTATQEVMYDVASKDAT